MAISISTMLGDEIIRHRAAIHRASLDRFEVRVARTVRELDDAYRLVHAAYVWQGYESVRDPELRITPQHVLPESTVLVAYEGDQLVATMTVTGDSDAGLPLDKDYPEALDELRRSGARLVEYGSLAAVERCSRTGVTTLLNIAAYRLAREAFLATHCVIGINPGAERFYRALYDYQLLATAKVHAHLKAPVVGMVQDIKAVAHQRHYKRAMASGRLIIDHFLGAPLDCIDLPDNLSWHHLAQWRIDDEAFRELYIERSDRLATLDDDTKRQVKRQRTMPLPTAA